MADCLTVTVRRVVRAVVWVVVLTAFALPLRHALVANLAYVRGYWSTAYQVGDPNTSEAFTWMSPREEAVHGVVHGLAEKGFFDEPVEDEVVRSPVRVWVSATGSAHFGEAPPEHAMVFGYGGAFAVAAATAYVMWAVRRSRDPR
ncbi:hypothetical protein [Streptomyces sp. WG-D5]